MSKRAQILNNLLFLADIYAYKSYISLKRFAQGVVKEIPPDLMEILKDQWMVFFRFVSLRLGVDTQEIIEWAITNQILLRQYQDIYWLNFSTEQVLKGAKDKQKYVMQPISLASDSNLFSIASFQGTANIPTMTLYEVKEVPEEDISQFTFLLPVIDRMFYPPSQDAKESLLKLFVGTNKNILNKISTQFEMPPTILGEGADGIAYAIGKNRVLKIFKSKSSFRAAKEAVERIWNNPSSAGREAMIYDVGSFNIIEGKELYYYIMEKMTPARNVIDRETLGPFLEKIEDLVERRFKDHTLRYKLQKSLNIPEETEKTRIIVKSMAKEIKKEFLVKNLQLLHKINNELKRSRIDLQDTWLNKLIEEMIWKYITDRRDLHGGNLGITPYGQFRYFDPIY